MSRHAHDTDKPPTRTLEDRLAPIMFGLAFVELLLVAGLIHRASAESIRPLEEAIMSTGLLILWPIFVVEAVFGFVRRCPAVSARTAIIRTLLVILIPSMRLAWVHPATNMVWLPRIGWHPPGKPLLKLLDKAFGVPMLAFAFLILPVLGAEYAIPDRVKDLPGFALALDAGIALIWMAFAVEFVVKVSASPSTMKYVKDRWLDLAIVLLPTLEFVLTKWVDVAPIARLLRLGKVIGPQQLARMNQIYRLRGVLMKGWHAFLVLEGISRLLGNTEQKRLAKLDDQIADLEDQIAELRAEADALRQKSVAPPEAATAVAE